MIDTIVLTLKRDMFTIFEPDRFTPSANEILDAHYQRGGRAFRKCTQNHTPRELQSGIYKPRLTLIRRVNNEGNPEISLKVEVSLPKLLFKNNFDEVEDKDFYNSVILLNQKLNDMGVEVSEFNLTTAPVSSIHYSKNIPLTDGSFPYIYLKEIQKANITQRLDFNQTDFRNEGQSVKFRANSYEIAFYDKLKDLEKAKVSEKRSEEKDNAIQFNLFEKIPVRKPFQLLRMEVRLNQRRKIKQVLKKTSLAIEPDFHSLYNKRVAKTILLYYLDEIENSYPKLLYMTPESTKDFIAQFTIENPKARIKDPLVALGFYHALEDLTTREIRELLKKYSRGNWYAFIKQINEFVYPKTRRSPFEPIRKSIEEFKPVKLVDFQDEMLNNDKYN